MPSCIWVFQKKTGGVPLPEETLPIITSYSNGWTPTPSATAMKAMLAERTEIEQGAWQMYRNGPVCLPEDADPYYNFSVFKQVIGDYGEWYYWKTLRPFRQIMNGFAQITEFYGLITVQRITGQLMNDKGAILNHNMAWKKGRDYVEHAYYNWVQHSDARTFDRYIRHVQKKFDLYL